MAWVIAILIYITVFGSLTFLAVYFNKWWIILFAILLLPQRIYQNNDEKEDK